MKIDSSSVIVITGASRGIGAETAFAFARKGARIVLAARDQTKLEAVAQQVTALGGQALPVVTDVSKQESCRALAQETLAKWQRVDVLVNNAGYGHYAAVENLATPALENIFRTNLFGSLWCTQAFLPQMKAQGRGHIVHVSTVISKRSVPYMTAYCMSKFAMNALDEGLRLELRPHGIGVSLVCPGLTETEFQMNSGKDGFAPPIASEGGMKASKVGQAILKAVQKNQRRVSLTFGGKLMVAVQRCSPFLVDEIIHVMFARQKRQSQTHK